MTKLICLRGYPGSGKSTIAEQIRAETGAEIVNRDAIRLMVLGSYWTGMSDKKTVDEGICLRQEGLVPKILKAKSPIFLGHETKLLDEGVEDLESAG